MRTRTLVVGAIGLALAIVAASLWQPVFSQTTKPPAVTAAPVPWTGTWVAAPQENGDSFNRQTLRQIVHTSIAGTVARVQLSNVFGNQPVTISDVHVARRTGGSSIDPSSDRKVTFGAATSVTIPAGGTRASDAVAFTVDALSDVAISFFLPRPTGPATAHNLSLQANYQANGDVAGDATLSNTLDKWSYYFLASLDVQNPAAEGAIVALGASITDGIDSPGNANRRWPNDLAVRLNQAGRKIGVLNEGISGNGLVGGGAGPNAPDRFDRDVLQQPNVRWVIFSDNPINDLDGNPNAGPADIAAAAQLIARAHDKGIKFLCSTLTPFEGYSSWTPTGEQGREAYNNFVRSPKSGCDGIVDQDLATHDPAHPTRYLPSLDHGDHLHPNEAGLQAIADAVNLSLFTSSGGGTNTGVISLRAHANGNLVTAENAGAAPLVANRTVVGEWEKFDFFDRGGGRVALRAHANNRYVSAANGGAAPLIADSNTIGTVQTFDLVHNADGSVALRATVNGKFVCADQAGTSPLIANRDWSGPWESYELIAG